MYFQQNDFFDPIQYVVFFSVLVPLAHTTVLQYNLFLYYIKKKAFPLLTARRAAERRCKSPLINREAVVAEEREK